MFFFGARHTEADRPANWGDHLFEVVLFRLGPYGNLNLFVFIAWKFPCNNEIMPIVRGMMSPSFLGEF